MLQLDKNVKGSTSIMNDWASEQSFSASALAMDMEEKTRRAWWPIVSSMLRECMK